MDFIRKEVLQMQNREHALIGQRDQKLKIITDAVQSIVIASIIIAFFLVVFGFSTHVKENKHRMLAEKKVKTYQDELKSRIEELAEANNELIQMRRQEKFAATGRIARTIAHEIRNPLTNINLATDQLSAEFPNNDENTDYLFVRHRSATSKILLPVFYFQSLRPLSVKIKTKPKPIREGRHQVHEFCVHALQANSPNHLANNYQFAARRV